MTVGRRVAVALAAHPELAGLMSLAKTGRWGFWQQFDEFTPVALVGERDWGQGWRDALSLSGPRDEVIAVRGFYADDTDNPRRVWASNGTLVDVVNALLTLPSPFSRFAPTREVPIVPGGRAAMWRPGMPL